MAQADYADGRDRVSGEPVALVPVIEHDPHVTDRNADAYFERRAGGVLIAEGRFERHRDAKLKAAIGSLRALCDAAEAGDDGLAASRAVQAATSDLIIEMLCERLREAKALIPGHVENEPARLRIDAALSAAGA